MRSCAALWIALCFSACAPGLDDPDRFRAPTGECALDVQEDILVPRCTRSSCHGPYDVAGGLEVVSGDLALRVYGAESTTCVGTHLVEPGHPEQSWLWMALQPDPQCDGAPMRQEPYDGSTLSDEELACIQTWVGRVADGWY